MIRKTFAPLAVLILAMAGIFAGKAEAQLRPSSVVLLPYFEVDLGGAGKTTLFAVGNILDQPVDVVIEVRTNWGIVVASIPLTLQPHEVKSFNLRDWLVAGKLPNKTLKRAEKVQLKTVLSGLVSPQDGLFYATAVAPDLAVGSVVITAQGFPPEQALWGDFLLVDPAHDISKSDDLVNLEKSTGCPGSWLCVRHALRYLSGQAVSADTHVIIWTDRSVKPSKNPYPESQKVAVNGVAYNEAGQQIGNVDLHLLPLQVVSVEDLELLEPFGWLDLRSEEPTFIGVHYDSPDRDGAALQAYCLKEPPGKPFNGPKIDIKKRTNDQDADLAPGPKLAIGSPVRWDYIVTNSGNVRLTDVTVSDDQGVQVTCPKTALDPGESMTCSGSGVAVACQYVNIGTATGKPPTGSDVTASNASHYFGSQNPKIGIETATNGQDADDAPGPAIDKDQAITWTYLVTNTGDVNLMDVEVKDSQGVAVSCPKTSLHPGESMTCTAHGTAAQGDYENIGTATAKSPCDETVQDSDPSHYHGQAGPEPPFPNIAIQKYTNGEDADSAPGPMLTVGDPVTWTYVVTNTGNMELTNVQVTDDQGVAVSCPETTLQPGDDMTCTGNGTAIAGQYANIGTVVGTPPSGPNVTDSDPSHYFGCEGPPPPPCGIRIKKYTNGEDADSAPGPTIPVGDAVHWTYVVTNMGGVVINQIVVTDDQGVTVSCPKTTLQPGEAMTCTGNGTATAGQYANVGTVVGTPPSGPDVTDSDPSHYYGQQPPEAKFNIKKYTNGVDADSAPGPTIPVGDAVLWTYVVTNTGGVALSNLVVTDDHGVAVSCPKTALQPGEAMTCTGNGTATAGQYANVGTVVGTPPSGPNVTDDDPSHYFGQQPPAGDQGCTPGYWKNHTDSWPPTGYSPAQSVQSVFSQASIYPALGSANLLDALSFKGGSTLEGAAQILLRAAVSALLNASHPNVSYPRTAAGVISDVNSALASGDRDTMLTLASALDADNNLGCPLN
jgi:hypothetical protein